METKRKENSDYQWTSDNRLKSVWTKTITTVKNKDEVKKEIENYKTFIDAGKSKLKAIKNERKNMKVETEKIKKDIDSCKDRINKLDGCLKSWA